MVLGDGPGDEADPGVQGCRAQEWEEELRSTSKPRWTHRRMHACTTRCAHQCQQSSTLPLRGRRVSPGACPGRSSAAAPPPRTCIMPCPQPTLSIQQQECMQAMSTRQGPACSPLDAVGHLLWCIVQKVVELAQHGAHTRLHMWWTCTLSAITPLGCSPWRHSNCSCMLCRSSDEVDVLRQLGAAEQRSPSGT